jgi:peptidoglycan/xylan/chitin deacetylase (PgdA/CDA1 family)
MIAYLTKNTALYISKFLGLFYLFKKFSRKKLRILCYHGFSHEDQSSFRPKLFIEKETFNSRIEYLTTNKFHFLTISDFENFLEGQFDCNNSVLLTIDDGWKSTYDIGLPILKKNKIPHIIYLYTDCYIREIPPFNVLIQYALWKTNVKTLKVDDHIYDLQNETSSKELIKNLLHKFENSEKKRSKQLIKDLFILLNISSSEKIKWDYFLLLNPYEIHEHLQHGSNFQLHTHHHTNPIQEHHTTEELLKNKNIIESVTAQKAEHLCYPSGIYSRSQFAYLKKLGLKSAVTCKPGLNDRRTNRYELKRFLDGENIPQIVFEAEMCGFMDFARKLLK